MSISRVDVGTPPDNFEGWVVANVCFHGFADLPTIRDEYVESPEFSCFGHQWALLLYPGGMDISPEGYVAVHLGNQSNPSIKIRLSCCVKNERGEEVFHQKTDIIEFDSFDSGRNGKCKSNFAKRSALMDLLVQGSLVIEVSMKLPSTDKSIIRFVPTNPINKNMLRLFLDEETADVVFEVGGQQTEKGADRTEISTADFHAHRPILQKCAPTLYEMCGVSGEGGITTVSITDVSPEIFKHMIYYAYGGKLSEDELKNNAKDIINACDKYGVVHLKLEAEAYYVESAEITMDNMMDNLLYADSKNLALLKEAVMDYIVANKKDIIGKVSFNDFPGHLVTDLLTAVARGEEQTEMMMMKIRKVPNTIQ